GTTANNYATFEARVLVLTKIVTTLPFKITLDQAASHSVCVIPSPCPFSTHHLAVDRLQLEHFGTAGVRSLQDLLRWQYVDPLPSFPHCHSTRPIVWIFSFINRSDPRHCAKQPRLLIHIVIVEPPFG
ncbi:hypothetical protein PAXINDRAFT_104240, partial [Paxillus involutus ATCC 200175]